jgi:hypothetical protein
MSDVFLFEGAYRGQTWRVQVTNHNGKDIVSIWPWYRAEDGKLRPGTGRYGKGGFQFPLERLGELNVAVRAFLEERAPDGLSAVS